MPRRNCQIVNPAAVAVEANHSGSNQLVGNRSDEKQLRLFRKFARNIRVGIIPGAR